MHLARRAPVAAGNIEGGRHGQYPHQQCRRRLRYTWRCSGNSRCAPALSCRGADLCRHGAVVGRCGRSRRSNVQQRWQRVVPERYAGNVRADEPLSCVAMADAAIQLEERQSRVITGLTVTAQRKPTLEHRWIGGGAEDCNMGAVHPIAEIDSSRRWGDHGKHAQTLTLRRPTWLSELDVKA